MEIVVGPNGFPALLRSFADGFNSESPWLGPLLLAELDPQLKSAADAINEMRQVIIFLFIGFSFGGGSYPKVHDSTSKKCR